MISKQKHRVGVKENSLVIRHLRLEGDVNKNHLLIVDEIDQLIGVDSVSINLSESLLKVGYDATKRQLVEIKNIVSKHQCRIAHDWWMHFKESHYNFVDKNVLDNANHEPWSCHRVPPGR